MIPNIKEGESTKEENSISHKEIKRNSFQNLPLNDQNSGKASSSTGKLLHSDDLDVGLLNPIPKKVFKKSSSLQLEINNPESSALKKMEINSESDKAEVNKVYQDLILEKPMNKSAMKKKKQTFGLDINTINENYTFGGEHGKQLASDMDDTMDKLFREVSELAKECVAYMSKLIINLL